MIALFFTLLVVASLVSGLVSMAHGGQFDQKHATHFMFARIGLQGVVILLFVLVATNYN
jgi:hypothetical protein